MEDVASFTRLERNYAIQSDTLTLSRYWVNLHRTRNSRMSNFPRRNPSNERFEPTKGPIKGDTDAFVSKGTRSICRIGGEEKQIDRERVGKERGMFFTSQRYYGDVVRYSLQ